MTYGSYLRRSRNGTLNFRFVVPKDLRPFVKQSELSVALGTASKRFAALACLELQLEAKRFVQAARTAIRMNDPQASQRALMSLIQTRRVDVLMQELNESDAFGAQQTKELAGATAVVGRLQSKLVELLLVSAGPPPTPAPPTAPAASPEALPASAQGAAPALASNTAPTPSPGSVPAPVAPAHSAPSSPLLSVAIDAFKSERRSTGAWTEKTSGTWDSRSRLLLDWFGNPPVSSLSRSQMIEFFNALKRLPKNAEKYKTTRGLGMRAQTELEGKECISASTVNLIMECPCSLFAWMDNDRGKWKISGNIAKGLRILKTQSTKRIPFDQEDLRAMLYQPEWKTRQFLHSYSYWLIPLGLYTGARINELCQIRLTDFSEAHGHPVVSICTDGLRAKNKNAMRTIPIHPELERLGLLRHVDRLRREGYKNLFPECTEKRDGHGQDASRWFGKFKVRAGIVDKRKVFHSTRHGFSTLLHNKGVDRSSVIAPLMGHAGKGESDRTYWNIKDVQRFIDGVKTISHPILEELVPVVEDVTFGVDVHQLSRRPPVRSRAPAKPAKRQPARSKASIAKVEC